MKDIHKRIIGIQHNSFFHSSLHAVAFREWNFMVFLRDGVLPDSQEEYLTQLSSALTSTVTMGLKIEKNPTKQNWELATSRTVSWPPWEELPPLHSHLRSQHPVYCKSSEPWKWGKLSRRCVLTAHFHLEQKRGNGCWCEHTCAHFCLYYLCPVFTQLLDVTSLFYWQWFYRLF